MGFDVALAGFGKTSSFLAPHTLDQEEGGGSHRSVQRGSRKPGEASTCLRCPFKTLIVVAGLRDTAASPSIGSALGRRAAERKKKRLWRCAKPPRRTASSASQ